MKKIDLFIAIFAFCMVILWGEDTAKQFDFKDNYTPALGQIVFWEGEVFEYVELQKTFYYKGYLKDIGNDSYQYISQVAADRETRIEIPTPFIFYNSGDRYKIYYWESFLYPDGDDTPYLLGYADMLDEGYYIQYLEYENKLFGVKDTYNQRI